MVMEVRKNTPTMNTTLQHDRAFLLPSDDNDQRRHYLLAELTRQLADNSLHQRKDPGSFGSWSGRTGVTSANRPPSRVPSPEAERDVAWELLYDAANEVARLKMEAMALQLNLHHQNRGINQYPPLKRQGYCQHHHHHHQSAWPSAHNHHQHVRGGSDMRTVYLRSGSGHTAMPPVKRQSSGTGVFIPQSQRVGSLSEPSRKKPTGCSTVLLPARVVQALNLDLEEINNGVHRNAQSHYPSGFRTDHDVLIARRNNAVGLRQEKASMKADEISLPTEWTY